MMRLPIHPIFSRIDALLTYTHRIGVAELWASRLPSLLKVTLNTVSPKGRRTPSSAVVHTEIALLLLLTNLG